jgi:hypothetical protein
MGRMMMDELERIWKKAVVVKSRKYPRTCSKRLRKITNTLCKIAGVAVEI